MPFRLVGDLDDVPIAFVVGEPSSVLGSAPECDLVLDHPTVSRRHAELTVVGDEIEIVDLGSRNGTFVGADRVSRRRARAGDTVAFGRVALVLEWLSAADVEPGLRLAPAVSRAVTAPPGSTLGTRAVDVFSLERLPTLLAELAAGADSVHMAQAVGAALFDALPALEVELAEQVHRGPGVLFHVRQDAPIPMEAAEVSAGGGIRVRVVFPHARVAHALRPLVESAAALVALADPPVRARPPDAASTPAPPDPPTVVAEVRRIYAAAARVARGDVGVLIGGESGTGKEILARYVHAASPRAHGAFVPLNCAALPRDLLETELFGIEKGVATGVEARPGKFELADGGTLFLDEIGDMALETQAKILRVLQEAEVYRIGGTAPRRAGVRVVAATNHDVSMLLRKGRFREDLYYRIATWTTVLPPLRFRRADIPNLAAHFLVREGGRRGIRVAGISRAALDLLVACPWPGNIRQLEKEMCRAVLFLRDGELLDTPRLDATLGQSAGIPSGASLASRLEWVEREEIERALARCDGDVTLTAELLGLGRSTLYRRMKELGIEPGADE